MSIKHRILSSKGDGSIVEVDMTPTKAIRHQCVECMGWASHEVKHCTAYTCPLYPYRMGKRPQDDNEDD